MRERERDGRGRKMFLECGGPGNKDRDFWLRLRRWDVVVLLENWLQEGGWRRIREWLPKD